jgi:hypothetical protein
VSVKTKVFSDAADLVRKFGRRGSENSVRLSDLRQLRSIRLPLPSLIAIFCLLLSGCSSNSSSSAPAATTTTTPGALATIKITATPLAIATNATDQFSATGADSNGNAITSLTVAWSSNTPSVATIDPNSGLATAVGPGVTAITASSSGVTSNPLFLTVTAPLDGQYAFLLQGFDDATGNQVAMIGSFTADGMGNITAGLEDINGPPAGIPILPAGTTLPVEVTFTGKYTTGTDNRGLISITNSLGTFGTFAFVAGSLSAGVPAAGRMIEFDDSTGTSGERAAGVFYMQNTADFALSTLTGPYALQFFGQQAAGSRLVRTGAFSADGNGHFAGGQLDTNAPPTTPSATPQSFTATLSVNSTTTTNTSTFGQLLLNFTSGPSINGYLYVISPAQSLFMESDAENSAGLVAGQILAQTSSPFSNASLSGTTVEYEQGLGSTAGQPAATIGLITFGSGTASVSRDYDDSGTLDGGTLTPETESLTFPVPSGVAPSGRVVLSNGAAENAIVYLVSPNEGFLMSATASATNGFFQPQAPGPSAASINGNYFFGGVPPSVGSMPGASTPSFVNPTVNSGEFTSPGNGDAGITIDLSRGSTVGRSLLLGETGFLGITVASTGRATDPQGDIYYLIGPSNFLMLIPNAAGTTLPTPQGPVIDVFQQ